MPFCFSKIKPCCSLANQERGRVCVIVGLGHCARANHQLHRMGMVEGEVIQVISAGKCMLVECGGSRVALCRKLAASVEVMPEPLQEEI